MTDAQTGKGTKAVDEDRMFDASLNALLHIDKKDYPCYVGGLMIASGVEHIVRSPVDESIIFGRFQEPEEGLPERAADVAAAAFVKWSCADRGSKIEIFERALDSIRKQKYRMAAAVTISSGMTRNDSMYEVERLIEITENSIEKIRKGVKGRPTGVWAVISEYNSPLAAPAGYAVSAMLAGNTVVLIPPKECPFPVYLFYDILVAAGLPDGVLNVIYDRRGKAAKALSESANISGIAATGRGDRFEDLLFSVPEDVLFISEFKGMNPLLVYRPASMRTAADIVLRSAFGYAGQRMSSCSKAVITAGEQRAFADELLSAAKKIEVGDPAEKGTSIGPLISKESMAEFLRTADEGKFYLVSGGKQVVNEITEAGCYVSPAVFIGLPADHELNAMDHSLPILSVQVANDLEEAMEMIADCELGSGAGIISKDEKTVKRFSAEAGADRIFVNALSDTLGVAVRADVEEFMKR